jgi:hypothetical protein
MPGSLLCDHYLAQGVLNTVQIAPKKHKFTMTWCNGML